MSWEHILSRISRNNINTSQTNRQIEKLDGLLDRKSRYNLVIRQIERYLVECKVRSQLDREKDQTLGNWIDRKIDCWIDRKIDSWIDRKIDSQIDRKINSWIDRKRDN